MKSYYRKVKYCISSPMGEGEAKNILQRICFRHIFLTYKEKFYYPTPLCFAYFGYFAYFDSVSCLFLIYYKGHIRIFLYNILLRFTTLTSITSILQHFTTFYNKNY